MDKGQPICILFAGAIGSSKTPIATYLSYQLNLPLFNNDAIRSEVAEDLGAPNEEEALKRRNDRIIALAERKISFICDASIDRDWLKMRPHFDRLGYKCFIISLDLSKELLTRLYQSKRYDDSLKVIDKYIADHEQFLQQSEAEIGFHITDKSFPQRLELSLRAAQDFINNHA